MIFSFHQYRREAGKGKLDRRFNSHQSSAEDGDVAVIRQPSPNRSCFRQTADGKHP
jgi:hypothetical protein